MVTMKGAEQEHRDARTAGAGEVVGSVGPGKVDPGVVALSSLSRVDYADHVVLAQETEPRASAERWARAMFGDTPDLTERLLWSGILRLRLHDVRSAATIAGWRITDRGDDWIRVSAASRSMSAVLIIRVTEATVELATVVRYDRARARALWVPTAFVHRRLAPMLLRSTARTVAGEGVR